MAERWGNSHVTIWIPLAAFAHPADGAWHVAQALTDHRLDPAQPVDIFVGEEVLRAKDAGNLPFPFQHLWAGLTATLHEVTGAHIRIEGSRLPERDTLSHRL